MSPPGPLWERLPGPPIPVSTLRETAELDYNDIFVPASKIDDLIFQIVIRTDGEWMVLYPDPDSWSPGVINRDTAAGRQLTRMIETNSSYRSLASFPRRPGNIVYNTEMKLTLKNLWLVVGFLDARADQVPADPDDDPTTTVAELHPNYPENDTVLLLFPLNQDKNLPDDWFTRHPNELSRFLRESDTITTYRFPSSQIREANDLISKNDGDGIDENLLWRHVTNGGDLEDIHDKYTLELPIDD